MVLVAERQMQDQVLVTIESETRELLAEPARSGPDARVRLFGGG
jgi:hypothetical protein